MTGLTAALGLFTVCPVPAAAARRPTAGVVRWLPVVGVLLAAGAGLPALAVWRGGAAGSPLLAAAVVVTLLAALTRGLHLDGLADLADGLGSRRPPAAALAVMKQSDVGPFGVATVVLTLLLQVAALATVLAAASRPEGLVLVAVAVVTGRVAVVLACGAGVPSARADGFGSLVAGSVGRAARVVGVLALLLAAGLAASLTASAARGVVAAGAAGAGLVAAGLLRRHAVRRLGGVTGDVFGALVETATTATLLVLAVAAVWR